MKDPLHVPGLELSSRKSREVRIHQRKAGGNEML